MNLWESARVALQSLAANKLRSALTMLGIIIGVAAVVAMVSIGQGASKQVTSQIGSLGSNLLTINPGRTRALPGGAIGALGSANVLTYDLMLALQNAGLPGVERVTAETSARAVARYRKNNSSPSIVGTTLEYLDVRNVRVQSGRFLTQYDVENMTRVAVLGPTVVSDLFGSANANPIGQTIRLGQVNFTVVGVMQETQGFLNTGDMVFIPITTAQKRLVGDDSVRSIYAQATSSEDAETAIAGLTAFLTRKLGDPEKFMISSQDQILSTVKGTSDTLTLLLAGITGISLIVGGIGIMNIMLVSVTERTREIGIRKAMGAKRRDVLMQFVVESTTLSSLGGFIGILAGIFGGVAISRAGGWPVATSTNAIAIAFLFSAGVGLLFGVYPAMKAARLDPIDALRYE